MALTFHVATANGTPTSIDSVWSDTEYSGLSMDEGLNVLPSNMAWEHITVASEDDKEAWIAAKNRWLQAAWSPNETQSNDEFYEDQRNRSARIRGAEETMKSLALETW